MEFLSDPTGEHGKLVVVVRIYEPSVRCESPRGQPATISSSACQPIVSSFPVSTTDETFGSSGQQGVQHILPYYWAASKSDCYTFTIQRILEFVFGD